MTGASPDEAAAAAPRRYGRETLETFAAGILRATGVADDHARLTAERLLEEIGRAHV
ncbi:MAG: hypothetical protein OXC06_18000 [Acidimicrobiaceae bacterium]|nr:hypothetical protein [Acidimicrobiaceae bacterium]